MVEATGSLFLVRDSDQGKNRLRSLLSSGNFGVMAVACLVAPFIIWAATTDYAGFVPLGIAGLFLAALSFKSPITVVTTIILFHVIVLEPTEGISAGEIAFGFYFFGYLIFWFLDKLIIKRERILLDVSDLLLISYVWMCFLSVVMAAVVGASIIKWFREFLTIATLLLYFPARVAFKTERDVKVAMVAIFVVALTFALKDIWRYRTASLAASYLWELLASRKPQAAHLFFGGSVVLLSLLVHARSTKVRLFLALSMAIFLLALTVTFARGFWIATLVGFAILLLLVDSRRRKSFLLYATIGTVFAVATIMLAYPHMSSFIFQTILQRFATSGSAFEDASVLERVAESKAVLHEIVQSPFVGHGMGATFTFYNLLDRNTVTTWYIHNAYLFLLFKVGAVGAFLFLGFYLRMIYGGIVLARDPNRTLFELGTYRGIAALLVGVLVVALTSNMFIEKESLLMVSVGTAVLSSSFVRGNPEKPS